MTNFKLNPGGLIGGLLFAVICAGTMIALEYEERYLIRCSFVALFVGAFAGNFSWEKLFPDTGNKCDRQDNEDEDRPRKQRRNPDEDKEYRRNRRIAKKRRRDEEDYH